MKYRNVVPRFPNAGIVFGWCSFDRERFVRNSREDLQGMDTITLQFDYNALTVMRFIINLRNLGFVVFTVRFVCLWVNSISSVVFYE